MDNTRNEKETTISLSDLLYVAKQNWLVEVALFLAIALVGGIYAKFFVKPYYVAQEDVIIKANLTNGTSYNDTTLAERYVETVSKLFKAESIIYRANELYQVNYPTESQNKKISAANVSVSSDETLLMTVSYKDVAKEDAAYKLASLIKAIENFSNELDDDGNKKFFNANISILSIGNQKTSTGSGSSKVIALALVGGLIVAFLYALFMYLVVDKVSTEKRLEAVTGKKNLISVTTKKTNSANKTNDNGFTVKLNLKKLSDTLIYMGDDNNKVYQIQSTVSGEGKTTVAVNLASALAESSRKTLIIDCDFYKPSVHKEFKLHRELGITDYFKGDKTFNEIVKNTYLNNVDIITCGDRIANHTIIFTSPKFKEIIDAAREKYDFVILDGAPVKAASDYINLTPLSDKTLMVVKSGGVSSREINDAASEIEEFGEIIGTIFNFSDNKGKKRNHYYYYYSSANNEEN